MQKSNRIISHPIIPIEKKNNISFFFNNRKLMAFEDEILSSALFANGIRTFGKHHKDMSEQGIFCANGQCSQCLVVADGNTVKACTTKIIPDMNVFTLDTLPNLPTLVNPQNLNCMESSEEYCCDVLIMGAGPAGLSAAIELAETGLQVILTDDKHELGGKLTLQPHKFFGTVEDCFAGKRGIEIAKLLSDQLNSFPDINAWFNSPVVGVFSDKKLGVLRDGKFVLVRPKVFLSAAGAREKLIAFPGCDLPGIYGAGAFQTLVNRDLIKAAKKIIIIGAGNVGLIAGFHALQAGIELLGIVEVMPKCSGYDVHLNKLKRLGVPIWNSHSIIKASGKGKLESVILSKLDNNMKPIPDTEKTIKVDAMLIAVGLSSINNIAKQSTEFGIKTYSAGDSFEVAEASAAMISGKIAARKILKELGYKKKTTSTLENLKNILASKPGEIINHKKTKSKDRFIYPVFYCDQEIPCDPCVSSCTQRLIKLKNDKILGIPEFIGKNCQGCGNCVYVCPGLAITLVNKKYDPLKIMAKVIVPWELPDGLIKLHDMVYTSGSTGENVGKGRVVVIKKGFKKNERKLIHLEVPYNEADYVAGIKVINSEQSYSVASCSSQENSQFDKKTIICRCERVHKDIIIEKIQSGCRDFNALKAELRVGMGACGGKSCERLIWELFRECGVNSDTVKPFTNRPFEYEIPLKAFTETIE